MLRITGDTHGDLNRINYAEKYNNTPLTEADTLIICGDFGFIFDGGKLEREKLDLLEEKPYTICFVDGNHENFDLLDTYPEVGFHGGKAHRIRENIYHLMRGEIYELEGKSVFAMGGAYSTDRFMRELGESYWEAELPSEREYAAALSNLESHGMETDIILTHTAPAVEVVRLGCTPHPHEGELTEFLDKVKYSVKYKKWYFGHFHADADLSYSMKSLCFDCEDL